MFTNLANKLLTTVTNLGIQWYNHNFQYSVKPTIKSNSDNDFTANRFIIDPKVIPTQWSYQNLQIDEEYIKNWVYKNDVLKNDGQDALDKLIKSMLIEKGIKVLDNFKQELGNRKVKQIELCMSKAILERDEFNKNINVDKSYIKDWVHSTLSSDSEKMNTTIKGPFNMIKVILDRKKTPLKYENDYKVRFEQRLIEAVLEQNNYSKNLKDCLDPEHVKNIKLEMFKTLEARFINILIGYDQAALKLFINDWAMHNEYSKDNDREYQAELVKAILKTYKVELKYLDDLVSSLSDYNLETIEYNMRKVIRSKEKHAEMLEVVENIDVSEMIKYMFKRFSESEYPNSTEHMIEGYLDSHIRRAMDVNDIQTLNDITMFFKLSQKCKDLCSQYVTMVDDKLKMAKNFGKYMMNDIKKYWGNQATGEKIANDIIAHKREYGTSSVIEIMLNKLLDENEDASQTLGDFAQEVILYLQKHSKEQVKDLEEQVSSLVTFHIPEEGKYKVSSEDTEENSPAAEYEYIDDFLIVENDNTGYVESAKNVDGISVFSLLN